MKIAVVGYSGAGKSTLATTLAQYYSIPKLHLDTL
ncbi:topology modulation protein [Streptococcus sp. BCA20]|nr:topology modulation protein [Streptococcus sp. BCA20]